MRKRIELDRGKNGRSETRVKRTLIHGSPKIQTTPILVEFDRLAPAACQTVERYITQEPAGHVACIPGCSGPLISGNSSPHLCDPGIRCVPPFSTVNSSIA